MDGDIIFEGKCRMSKKDVIISERSWSTLNGEASDYGLSCGRAGDCAYADDCLAKPYGKGKHRLWEDD